MSPGDTRTSVTVPARSASTSFSIFMASSTQTRLADLDRVAHRHQHLDDRALHGRGDPPPARPLPPLAAPSPAPRRGAGAAATGGRRRTAAAASGSHTRTS